MSEKTYYATDFEKTDTSLTQEFKKLVPDDVYEAIIKVLSWQEETQCEVKFGIQQPSVQYRSRWGRSLLGVNRMHPRPWLKISNLPRKFMLKALPKEVRNKKQPSRSPHPINFVFEMDVDGNEIFVMMYGDAEKQAQKEIAWAAERHGREHAEELAGRIFRSGHKLADLDNGFELDY